MMMQFPGALATAARALLLLAAALILLVVQPIARTSAILVQKETPSKMLRHHHHGHHRAAQEEQAANNRSSVSITTIVATVENMPSLSKFHEALNKANLLDELRSNADDDNNNGSSSSSLTVFMPINDAFDALSPDLRAKLFDPKWILHLQEILLYHIYKSGEQGVSATDMVELSKIGPMENGEFVTITTTATTAATTTTSSSNNNNNQDGLLFNTAHDIIYTEFPNGDFSYVIDQVLIPSFITTSLLHVVSSMQDETSTFANLLVTAGLESTLNDPNNAALTVLAPSNAAFAALGSTMLSYLQSTDAGLPILKQIVLYHILPFLYASTTFPPGSSQITTLNGNSVDILRDDIIVLVNGQYLTSPDHVANNGIVHVLGQVLIPPGVSIPTTSTTSTSTDPTDPSMTTTLVNAVSETSTLSSLNQAIVAAGDMVTALLSDSSSQDGPYTLFAPIDAAFDMFPTVQNYMSDSAWILHLQEVLKFHVTKSTLLASDDLKNTNNSNEEWMMPMLNGENVMVTIDDSDDAVLLSPAVMGTATVSGVEMSAMNGKAYVINRILLPSFVFTNMLEQAVVSNAALGSLVESPDLATFVEYLTSKPGITFFAPSDAALSAMGGATQEDFTMEELFFYHTVEMVLPSNSISPGTTKTVRSVQGGDLTITKSSNGDLLVNGVAIVSGPDNLSRDGVVHVLDRVLTIPETKTTTTTPGQPVPQPVQEPVNQPQPPTASPATSTITTKASCSSNPQCASSNLEGLCCPTAEMIMLDCCFPVTTQQQQQQQQQQGGDNVITPNMVITTSSGGASSCSSHARCADLAGDCCPTLDNVYLECCDS